MPVFDGYPALPGVSDSFRGFTNLAAASGLVDPRTRKPLSEAMVLGISGGLGCGYILWEFKAYQSAILTLGFSYRWNYGKEVLLQTAERIGMVPGVHETGGKKSAANKLAELAGQGIPALAFVDPYFMPHRGVPDHREGCGGVRIVICGREGDDWLVQDGGIFRVSDQALVDARARVGSYKHFLMWFPAAGEPFDLRDAVLAGIHDHLTYLKAPSTSFGIPALVKWAKLMTGTKDKKSWRTVFRDGNGLYSALTSLYSGVEGETGGALRGLYADFLTEAAETEPALASAAARYREAQTCWRRLAEHAVAALPETGRAVDQRFAALAAADHDALAEANRVVEDLRRRFDPDFREPAGLFEQLQQDLQAVVAAEITARDHLSHIIETL
ncbi:BtrH N-terminal domain-containing protein [Acanthopleuribacter pedis]|uniref:DUF4872 domain-containing protein n=1 Tax=Acanthopleuribacter pedis TaxID=442870 RepID=A0A8J7U760_9BACT|nr:BtrH N-terminal domain-containing protein [Acanthopleuribacter pedis]MBO1322153.1 DUF4872 domain-containing protein [Acanthopleuribacter pedis]